MNKLELTLETVTPLFLAGAEPETDGELRPASFRGGMRYWLRAMLGAKYPIEKVRQIESEVFGAAEQDVGAAAINLSLQGNVIFDAHKAYPSGSKTKASGHDYLYWSMGMRGNRQSAKPGQTFKLVLRQRFGASNGDDAFELAARSLWLLLNLGGMGSRSRRTGGSLGVQKFAGDIPLSLSFETSAASGEDLRNELAVGLKSLCQPNHSVNPSREFDILDPRVCRIWVISSSQDWTTWQQAVEGIGAAMRDFRSHKEYQSAKDVLAKHAPTATISRAVFGLPIQFRYKDIEGFFVNSQYHERRGSPLHLKVSRLKNNKYVGVAVLFKSKFLPDGEILKAKGATVQPPRSFDLIEQFIASSFKNHWEVTGW